MSDLIYYDPEGPVGQTGGHDDGGPGWTFVPPERFFVARLAEVLNPVSVFLQVAMGAVPEEYIMAVDDALAAAFWDDYEGCVVPRRLLRAIARAAQNEGGRRMLDVLEEARADISGAASPEDAADIGASYRIQLLKLGADRKMGSLQVAVAELATDIILLQRGAAEDIRRAEEDRGPGEARAVALLRRDRSADMVFERLLSQVLYQKQARAALPARERRKLERFARERMPLHKPPGLLETLGV